MACHFKDIHKMGAASNNFFASFELALGLGAKGLVIDEPNMFADPLLGIQTSAV